MDLYRFQISTPKVVDADMQGGDGTYHGHATVTKCHQKLLPSNKACSFITI